MEDIISFPCPPIPAGVAKGIMGSRTQVRVLIPWLPSAGLWFGSAEFLYLKPQLLLGGPFPMATALTCSGPHCFHSPLRPVGGLASCGCYFFCAESHCSLAFITHLNLCKYPFP